MKSVVSLVLCFRARIHHGGLCKSFTRVVCLCFVFGSAGVNSAGLSQYDQNPSVSHIDSEPAIVIPGLPELAGNESGTLSDENVQSDAGIDANGLIDINTATAGQLASALPGIGPAKAARIIEWRDINGPFKSVDQLIEVQGIGPRTLERLRPLVRVGDAVAAATSLRLTAQKEQTLRRAIGQIVERARLDARGAAQGSL